MRILLTILAAVAAVLWAGCGNRQSSPPAGGPHLHVDVPPHGGTPVALGDDYQIEWVLDAPGGKLQAYVLDGEMENFVRISPASFEVTAKLPDGRKVLHFTAIPNSATGEKVGSTSLFETQADWLKTTKTFDAVIHELDVKGTTFSNVAFNFPKGSAPDEKEAK
jgi:hypothetical protein